MDNSTICREQVLSELAAIGFAPTGEFFCHAHQPERISPSALASVAAFERNGNTMKFKFYDKLQALELLGRFLGMDGAADGGDPGLLAAILNSTKEDLNGISGLQSPTDAGAELVEQTGDEPV